MLPTVDEIVANFELLDDWEERYRYLIELGRMPPTLPPEAHTDVNKVQGCASQVWLERRVEPAVPEPILHWRGDSDAHIVRGLIALLLALYFGQACVGGACDRRDRPVPEPWPVRAPHAPAVERRALDGRAHPQRRPYGDVCNRLKRQAARATPTSSRDDPTSVALCAARSRSTCAEVS